MATTLITAREFAQLLKVGQSTFERLQAEGALPPHFYIGRTRRWHKATAEKWIADGCPEWRTVANLKSEKAEPRKRQKASAK